MTLSRSTRSKPSRCINWVFFDSTNKDAEVVPTHVYGYDVNKPLGELGQVWVEQLRKRYNFRANPWSIKFYKPDSSILIESITPNWLADIGELKDIATLKQSALKLSKALPEADWNEDYVHFFITAQRLSDDEALAEEQEDTVTELPLDNLLNRYETLLKRAESLPPSKSAKSTKYAKLQGSPDTAIYDGFYKPVGSQDEPVLATIAPPVQIFHPVFQQFLDNIDDPAFEPDERTVASVADLMSTAAAIRSGDNGAEVFRRRLSKIFDAFVGQLISDYDRSPYGTISKSLPDCFIPLIVVEYERALGEEGCDPLRQASYSVLYHWKTDSLKRIREKCCCPTFIVAGGGPYLSICGVVFTDKLIVQRLTDILWLGEASTYEDAHLYCLARIFASLSQCCSNLSAFYDDINTQPNFELTKGVPHPRWFPYPTSFTEYGSGTVINFKYINMLQTDPTNITFLAQTPSEKKLVVKFVDRYGIDAHEFLAAKGMAPKLLFCGLLTGDVDVRSPEGARATGETKVSGLYVGPLRMVIMEYVEGSILDTRLRDDWPGDVHSKIKEVLKELHEAGFVFGDLRPPNVIYLHDPPKAMFIDFDWAGEEGKVRYPNHLSNVVTCGGARDFELITKEHDEAMLQHYFH